MRRSMWALVVALLALSLGVAACGGDDDSSSETSSSGSGQGTPAKGKKGGTLTSLWAGDVDYIDPGQAYAQWSYMITRATQRAPLLQKVDDATNSEPDLAESMPEVSSDGCTVTLKIKQGIKFSPPVNREVEAKDVKYAIERGFFNSVNNGYAGAYYGDIKGAKVGVKPGTEIPGITTPDKYTVVFKLTPKAGGKCTGGTLIGSMVLPLAAPVPKEYAAKFDAKTTSTYGDNQVATGPYMVANDASGKAVGYQAGKSIHLVRNPSWSQDTDVRPAYVDEVNIIEGNDDPSVMGRKILTGNGMVTGDTPPPAALIRQALTNSSQKSQIQIVPGLGGRYIALNNTLPPFNDVNVRKAVQAGFDREAMRLARGGAAIGDIATHYLPPGFPGFDEAGGLKGPGDDFMANPKGDMALAAEYFKKAGFASGKYEGTDELLMVGDNTGPGAKTTEVAKAQFEKLGFKVRLRSVEHAAMYTKFCSVPKAKVEICPNVGWQADFTDGQAYLDPTFNGANILPTNNSNWPQLNDKTVNQEIDAAMLLTDPKERATAWAEVDKKITALAPAVNWLWDKTPSMSSKDVNMVIDLSIAEPSIPYSSIK
jgi:peptide/nickel transport system substrate-binding protein